MRLAFPFALLIAGPAFAASPCDAPPEDAVILTIAGDNTNRGPLDPARDKFMAYHDIAFEGACALSRADLTTFEAHEITLTLPDEDSDVTLGGPWLDDVIAAAGLGGDSISVMALDGYAASIPREMIAEQGAIIATQMDGRPLGLGDFGPAMVVFPGGTQPPLSKYWVWSVFYISGE